MKNSSRLLVIAVLAIVFSWAGTCFAQDPGVPDSVIIDLAGAVRHGNDSLSVSIIVSQDGDANGETMTGLIPLYYASPDDYWIIDTTYFISDRWTAGGSQTPPSLLSVELRPTEDPDTTKLSVYWLSFGAAIAGGRDTIITIHFKKDPAVSTPQGFFEMGFTTVQPQAQELLFVAPLGASWTPVMAVTDGAGGYGLAPDSIPTDVVEIASGGAVPETYSLSQNYPNPFNANTRIEFALREPGNVRLDIFNILGQKVATPVNEYLTAGLKRVDWDGTDETGQAVASGMYFYRLSAGNFTEMKKMVLMK